MKAPSIRALISVLIFFAVAASALKSAPPQARSPQTATAAKTAAKRIDRSRAIRLTNLGVAYMNQQAFEKALSLFRQAGTADPRLSAARLNEAIALLNLQKTTEARAIFLRITRSDPNSAAAWYNLGLANKAQGDRQGALQAFAQAAKLVNNDPDLFYQLGAARSDTGDYDAAISALQKALDLDPFHASAEFALARAHQRKGNGDDAQKHLARFQELTRKKLGTPMGLVYGEQGRLSLAIQVPYRVEGSPQAISVAFTDVSTQVLPALSAGSLAVCAFEIDPQHALLLVAGNGAHLLRDNGKGVFADVTSASGISIAEDPTACAAGDFDNDGLTDLAVSTKTSFHLLRNVGGGKFEDVTKVSQLPTAAAGRLTWFDFDHDGDLDLFIGAVPSTSVDAALWRNNGNGTFANVSSETGFGGRSAANIFPTDFNDDRAIDAVVLSPAQPVRIALNQREGPFADADPWPRSSPQAGSATIFDFDKNGTPDLLLTSSQAPALTLWRNRDGRKLEPAALPPNDWKLASSTVALDFDNDGFLDFAAIGETAAGRPEIKLLRNAGDHFVDVTRQSQLDRIALKSAGALLAFDIDRDGDTDLLVTQADSPPVVLRNDGGNRNHWLRLALRGLNDNKSAIGTKVEVFAGNIHQKFEITGVNAAGQSLTDLIVGLGQDRQADIVRALWPTGVLQDEIEVAAGTSQKLNEIDRRGSSCPVLFAWDGTRFRFVSDMIGSGVFGHWVAPGELNVADPSEYLKIDGFSPQPVNGKLRFRFIEPMEETVYLDQLRLVAVDHPASTEVFANEYFATAPPFPAFKIWESQEAQPITGAWDTRGQDVTSRLQKRDRIYADGFDVLPFKGFTKPQSLILDIGEPYQGGPLRLLLSGYIEYFTATGMFSAHQAGIDPQAPAMEALIGGKWIPILKDMGFPAGLPRTTVAELTGKIPLGTTRLRILTNLQIYWDQILVDRTLQDQHLRIHDVPLATAALAFRGYPRTVEGKSPGDITYIYEQVSASGPYTRQRGAYTRFGDVSDLLSKSDDEFAVFGSGEEVAVEFDAAALPSPPTGWERTYFFFADGYEKDMDFYASDFLSVEPLPFHDMDVYPGEGKPKYPVGKHARYLLQRNDRFGSAQGNRFRFSYRSQLDQSRR